MNNFDTTKYRLGVLCKRGHDWGNGQSLRYQGSYSCVECSKIRSQEYEKRNREKRNQQHREWKEKNPEKWKAAQERYWSKPESLAKRAEYSRQYRQRPECKERHRKESLKFGKTSKGAEIRKRALKRYYQTEKGKACAREFVKRRRARKQNAHTVPFSESDRKNRMMLFDGQCSYCGCKAEVLDHFIPLAKGGTHTLGNLLPACSRCNRFKSDKSPDEWYSSQPFYSKRQWHKILKALGKTPDNYNQLPLL